MHDEREAAAVREWRESRLRLERATSNPALHREAHRLLWDVCQCLRDPDAALAHLQAAISEDPLFSRPHLSAEPPVRSVLVLAAPGDYQANLPLDRLFDASTLLHTLWIVDAEAVLRDPAAFVPVRLPPVDCVFVAVAEDVRHGVTLRAADALAAVIGRPTINRGERIAVLSRAGTAHLLGGVPDAVVPSHLLVARGQTPTVGLPLIIRPLGSHAGDRLHRVDTLDELAAYYARERTAEWFTVAPFIDYQSADGLWRKYRIIFVDGAAYPLHLAIHDDWAVWYYNSGMAACTRRQDEERRFLDDLSAAIPPKARAALREIAARVGLDYFGLDCSLAPDGRLLVFEIETGMIVQNGSGAAATRVRQALERMIDCRRQRSGPLAIAASGFERA